MGLIRHHFNFGAFLKRGKSQLPTNSQAETTFSDQKPRPRSTECISQSSPDGNHKFFCWTLYSEVVNANEGDPFGGPAGLPVSMQRHTFQTTNCSYCNFTQVAFVASHELPLLREKREAEKAVRDRQAQ